MGSLEFSGVRRVEKNEVKSQDRGCVCYPLPPKAPVREQLELQRLAVLGIAKKRISSIDSGMARTSDIIRPHTSFLTI